MTARGPLRVPALGLTAAGGRVALDADTSRYVARVHRLGPGDALVLFDPEAALEADARVVEAGKRDVVVEAGPAREASVRARRRVTLLQATGKGDKLDAIVRDATELGATSIVPVVAARSVSRPAAEERRSDRWRRIALEAARQCGRGDAPSVEAPAPLLDAVARFAPEAGTLGLCLDPAAAAPIGVVLRASEDGSPVVILVGPEGGLDEGEMAAAERAGFQRVSLGPIVLRTETVCAAVLGALAALHRGGQA